METILSHRRCVLRLECLRAPVLPSLKLRRKFIEQFKEHKLSVKMTQEPREIFEEQAEET
jgi:hypothetical protein